VAGCVAALAGAALAVSRIVPAPPASRLDRRLEVVWAGCGRVELITAPGKRELEFPCSHVAGEVARLSVEVSRLSQTDDGGRSFRACSAEDARLMALAGGGQDVRFEDAVCVPGTPAAQQFGPVELPEGGRGRVAVCFTTAAGLACLVTDARPGAVSFARCLVAGDRVSVRGRAMRGAHGEACVLVDELRFATSAPPDEPPWTVTARWGGMTVAQFSKPGDYPVRLPCLHGAGKWEAALFRLRQFRAVELSIDGIPVVAQLAATEAQRRLGLQDCLKLGPDEGMLFYFERPLVPVFEIKLVRFPLSVAFIRSDGTIVGIGTLRPDGPFRTRPREPVRYVLEMAEGWFESHGVKPGDRVEIP